MGGGVRSAHESMEGLKNTWLRVQQIWCQFGNHQCGRLSLTRMRKGLKAKSGSRKTPASDERGLLGRKGFATAARGLLWQNWCGMPAGAEV